MWRQIALRQQRCSRLAGARHRRRCHAVVTFTARPTRIPAPKALASSLRALSSSAQPSPSSWEDDHDLPINTTTASEDESETSPFLMSTAPCLAQMGENPTAERVVIKSLLNTLQVNTNTTTAADGVIVVNNTENAATMCAAVHVDTSDAVAHDASDGGFQRDGDERVQAAATTEQVESLSDVNGTNSTPTSTSTATRKSQLPTTNSDPVNDWNNKLYGRLDYAVRTKDTKTAIQAYKECVQNGVKIQPTSLVNLFNIVLADKDPIVAHRILRHYHRDTGEPAHQSIYANLCKAVGMVHWRMARTANFAKMVQNLQKDLLGLDMAYQRRCLPNLLSSLIEQPNYRIGRMANDLYQYMVENECSLSCHRMCHILNVSRHTRQGDLSFPTILARLVSEGHQPPPTMSIHVLQNLFPFDNVKGTILAMKTIIKLQSSCESDSLTRDYRVDIGTLEHIMSAAARAGSFELNILVWDLVDLLGYEPTECMYENTIQGFVMGVRQDHNALAVLGEMEERGFVPSRALIRSLSRSMRFSDRRVLHARHLLTSSQANNTRNAAGDITPDGVRITVSSLNVILSAAAEIGDVDLVFAIFDDFGLHGIEPNADSYSFLLEGLSSSVRPSKKLEESQKKLDAPSRMDAASAILSLMEENGIPLCQNCTEHYAQLLYNVGRLDAATEFLLDSLARGDPVSNRIIFNLSKNNAEAGNIEVARLLATKTSEHFDHLEQRIDGLARRLKKSQSANAKVDETPASTDDENE